MSSSSNVDNSSSLTAPLLSGARIFRTRPRFLRRPPTLRGAARFLRRASSRGRAMREPSLRVREAAAEQIEERQSDWTYSKPIVILDLVWNITFVIISMSVLIVSRQEAPSVPLRLWIVGYALQCVAHMVCVCAEYKKRYSLRNTEGIERGQITYGRNNSNSSSETSVEMDSGDYGSEHQRNNGETRYVADWQQHATEKLSAMLMPAVFCDSSISEHLESANTMFSFTWWIVGFYWISAAGPSLMSESPQLYWLCITLMAFEVFFVVICIAVALVVGIAVCCCLPCIIAILFAVADQEGATKEDIERLPRYTFRKIGDLEKQTGELQESFRGIMTECDTNSPSEHVLPIDDAECCICLCAYEDGTELRELPCCHHFHLSCIDKWLHLNATCPLCKYNILKNDDSQSGSEEV